MLMGSNTNKSTLLRFMRHYQQEAFNESIGACTNNLAVSTYRPATQVLLLRQSLST